MLHVNVATGELCHSALDFSLPGFIPFELERNYRSASRALGALGWNWLTPLDVHLAPAGNRWIFHDSRGTEVALEPSGGDGDGLLAAAKDGSVKLFRQARSDRKDHLVLATPGLRRLQFPIDRRGSQFRPSAIEDANGNALAFHYGDRGDLILIVDTCGRRIRVSSTVGGRLTAFQLESASAPGGLQLLARYDYDADNNLVAVYDAHDHAIRFEYADHLLVRCVNRLGGSAYAEYDARRRCVHTWWDGGLRQRQLAYDDERRATSVTNSLGHTTIYRWNVGGLVTEEITPLGHAHSNLYDPNNGLLASLDDAGSVRLATLYDPAASAVMVVDAAGATTSLVDDANGNLAAKTDAVGAKWQWRYDRRGNLVAAVRPSGATVSLQYDPTGFLEKTIDEEGRAVTQSRVDGGRTLLVADEFGPLMKYEYDDRGDLIAATDAAGGRHLVRRDELGRVVERVAADGARLAFHYDAEGNLLSLIDDLGRNSRCDYDRFGRCLRYVGRDGATVRYDYDSEGNPVGIIDETGRVHAYTYDPDGQITRQDFFDGTSERYEYDGAGHIVAVSDGAGRRTRVARNTVGRIVQRRFADGTADQYSYDGLRRLADLQNDAIQIHLEWDGDGNLVEERQGEFVLTHSYDRRGNRIGMATSTGRTIRYHRDRRGRVVGIEDSATGRHHLDYDAFDRLTHHQLPGDAALALAYDPEGRIVSESLRTRSGEAIVRRYRFDRGGRLVEFVDSHAGARYFDYDAADRLLAVRSDRDTLEQFRYDAAGNMVESAVLGTLVYAPGNLLVRTNTDNREYDPLGQLIRLRGTRGTLELTYDGAGRLARVTHPDGSTTTYAYDPFGRRVAKERGGQRTRYVWDGFTLLEESTGDSRTIYLFDADRMVPLAAASAGPTVYYAVDRRGCVFATVNERAELTGEFEYSAFGALAGRHLSDELRHPFRLRGQYADEETGFHYCLHRYYDPGPGRFLTRDPLGIDAGRNLYQFGPNPITWEDPFGLSSECQGDVFYRAMSDKEKKKVIADCQLHAKKSKCPEGPYVTQNREEAAGKLGTGKKKNKYEHLVEICTKPGTAAGLSTHPLACRNGSQAAQFPGLSDVVSGNANRIEHKMENGNLNYGLSSGEGLNHFNQQVESMKVVGTDETCTPTR